MRFDAARRLQQTALTKYFPRTTMPEIQMPKLSDTMTEGTLVTWRKKKGDKVSAGEVIAEIETDKATMEWESPEDGTLTEVYIEEGGKVNVGDRIAFIGGEGEAAPAAEKKSAAKTEKAEEKKPPTKEQAPQAETEKPAPAAKKEKETAPPQQKQSTQTPAADKEKPDRPEKAAADGESRVKASPVARRVAGEL